MFPAEPAQLEWLLELGNHYALGYLDGEWLRGTKVRMAREAAHRRLRQIA
jgi:hypothetical protein